jgi:hypothetical protein
MSPYAKNTKGLSNTNRVWAFEKKQKGSIIWVYIGLKWNMFSSKQWKNFVYSITRLNKH